MLNKKDVINNIDRNNSKIKLPKVKYERYDKSIGYGVYSRNRMIEINKAIMYNDISRDNNIVKFKNLSAGGELIDSDIILARKILKNKKIVLIDPDEEVNQKDLLEMENRRLEEKHKLNEDKFLDKNILALLHKDDSVDSVQINNLSKLLNINEDFKLEENKILEFTKEDQKNKKSLPQIYNQKIV